MEKKQTGETCRWEEGLKHYSKLNEITTQGKAKWNYFFAASQAARLNLQQMALLGFFLPSNVAARKEVSLGIRTQTGTSEGHSSIDWATAPRQEVKLLPSWGRGDSLVQCQPTGSSRAILRRPQPKEPSARCWLRRRWRSRPSNGARSCRRRWPPRRLAPRTRGRRGGDLLRN